MVTGNHGQPVAMMGSPASEREGDVVQPVRGDSLEMLQEISGQLTWCCRYLARERYEAGASSEVCFM